MAPKDIFGAQSDLDEKLPEDAMNRKTDAGETHKLVGL